MPLSLLSIAANTDGLTAVATLSGAPSGTLVFTASATPDGMDPQTIPYTGSGPYTLTFPFTYLWFVTANDTHGPSTAKPVWLKNIATFLDECGMWVQNRIKMYLPAIQAGIAGTFPNTTIKQVLYGFAAQVVSFPSIVVSQPSASLNWIGTPFLAENTMSAVIAVDNQANTEITEIRMVTQIAQLIAWILNQPSNLWFTLPSGIRCYEGAAAAYRGEQMMLENGRFPAAGTVSWSAKVAQIFPSTGAQIT